MITLTKEWLLTTIAELEEERDAVPGVVNVDAAMALAAMKLARASLEAEIHSYTFEDDPRPLYTAPPAPEVYNIGYATMRHIFTPAGITDVSDMQAVFDQIETVLAGMWQPAPVSVPAAMEMDDDFDSAFEHGKAVGWNACRAAMLQGADRPQNEPQNIPENIPENIPATQFKPVADLYGLTSPTGGETSFTFDAVEARDFIDGGWSCQEYVELGRFQEAMLQNGNSPAQSDCCPEQNYIAPAQDGNSPVIPDGWVACSERMPEVGVKVLCFPVNDEPIHATYNGQVWLQDISWSTSDEPIDNVISCNVFHWMPLPVAPQQED